MNIGSSISVVVPVFNEEENIYPLAQEIGSALKGICDYEIIFVNDCSTDDSTVTLTKLKSEISEIRVIHHLQRSGQSAGLLTGILAAKNNIIVTLDGDGQNDPADIPSLLKKYEQSHDTHFAMITGHRVTRKDSWAKRYASKIANTIRAHLLKDDNPDTGCGLKLFDKNLFLRLPYFDHIHRFLPALAKREGCRIFVVPVNHRNRRHGVSKYANFQRLVVGIIDLLGVMWLIRRYPKNTDSEE